MGTFPRRVVISPRSGAGIATWMEQPEDNRWLPYERVEDPDFVAYIESGGSDPEWVRYIWESIGLLAPGEYVCLLGLPDAEVVEVPGPYRITEYDGAESIELSTDPWWRH